MSGEYRFTKSAAYTCGFMTLKYQGTHRCIMIVLSIALCRLCAFAATVTVNDFGDHQVLQRSIGGTSATVSVGGAYVGSEVDHIQARVVKFTDGSTVVDWQTIASGLSGGTYGGTIVVPQGGWYRIAVSGRDASGTEVCQAIGAHRWGVGINVLCIGQSNMVGNGGIRSGYTTVTTDLAGLYSNSNGWKKLSDPYDSGGVSSEVDYDSWYGASMIPSFANSLANAFPTIPIGIVPAAKGGTPLHGTADTCWIRRDPANHANPSNLYGNSIANARAVGGVELIIMHQGETDATNNASEAQYESDFDTLIARYRQDLYSTIPLFFCQLGRSFTDTVSKHRTDTTMQRIRNAQHDLDDPAGKVYLSALCIDLPVATNDDHYTKPGHDTIGGRLGNAVNFYYGVQTGNPPYYRGPEITSASFADSNRKIIDVTIAHRGGNDFTPSTGITGFQVTNDGDTMTISSAVRQNASTIRLTLSKAITGSAAVRYLVGKHPNVAGAVHDNTPLHLPLEPTTAAIIVPHINTLSITIVSGGTVTKNPDRAFYIDGSTVRLTAAPQTGYHFAGWSGDLTGANSDTTIVLTSNRNITATFTIPKYSLTLTSTNGTVAKVPSQTLYDSNTVVQLTATPAAGYTFTGWSGDASGSTNPINVTMSGNKSITANFTIKQYSLTLTSTNGTVTKSPSQSLYDSNTVVQLTASQAPGYTFTGWSGDASGSTNPLNVTMNGNKSITANFTITPITQFSLTLTSTNGTVAKVPSQTLYDSNTVVQLTATPATGYTFTGWSGDASGSTNPLNVTMNGNKNITASFTITPITQFSLTLTSTNGTIAKVPSQTLYDSNTVVQLTATPATGYTFSGWSGDASGSTNPLNVTMSGNKTITTSFTINQCSITLTSTNGTVTKNPNQPAYPYGSSVRLTAAPQTGFHFGGWSGDLTGVTADTTIILTANRSIIATFSADSYTLSIMVVGIGTVTKNPDQPAYPYGSSVRLTAAPQTGCRFAGWSGDLSDTTNPIQIMMNGTKNVTANFAVSAPPRPTLRSPLDGANGLPLSLSLLWNKTALAQTYHVQVSNSSAFAGIFKEDSSLTDTSYSPSSLTNNTRYFWHVRTKNAGGVSDWSLPWSFSTIVATPAAVIPIAPARGDTIGTDSVNLVWHKTDSTVMRYWLEIGIDSTMTGAKIDSLSGDTATMMKSLINKRTYWWRVRANNAAGWGAFSEKQYFSVNIPSVEVLTKNYQLLLHSLCLRRSDRMIGYSLPQESHVSMRMYDIHGKLILSLVNSRQPPGYYTVSFDRQSLPVGNYILQFKAGTFEVRRKLTIVQ